jgi:hypothetical protein
MTGGQGGGAWAHLGMDGSIMIFGVNMLVSLNTAAMIQ